MLKISGKVGYGLVICIVNQVIQEGIIPSNWYSSIIVSCYKGKGDILDRSDYRSIKLLGQVIKIMARDTAQLIRNRIRLQSRDFHNQATENEVLS